MASEPRVALYIDFDNIVISRYSQVNGPGKFQIDRVRNFGLSKSNADADLRERFTAARVDVNALFEFASEFGVVSVRRAYADWSMPANTFYKKPMTANAVDLVQLFPAGEGTKNGADIRLAIDVMDDLAQLPDITHVVIVAGDSDYVALAQRVRRLGRTVIGIGVAGSTSKALVAACDEFIDYDQLIAAAHAVGAHVGAHSNATAPSDAVDEEQVTAVIQLPPAGPVAASTATGSQQAPDLSGRAQARATDLLLRVLRAGGGRDDSGWMLSSTVKSQMRMLDSGFDESKLGYGTFTGFIRSREEFTELTEDESGIRRVKLRA